MAHTILFVDENQDSRLLTKWFLANLGYSVDAVASAQEALEVFDSARHDVVITDSDMAGMTGEELAHVIKIRSEGTSIMMFAARSPRTLPFVDLIVRKPMALPILREKLEMLRLRRNA